MAQKENERFAENLEALEKLGYDIYEYASMGIGSLLDWFRRAYHLHIQPYPFICKGVTKWWFEVYDLTKGDITSCNPIYKCGIPSQEEMTEHYYIALYKGIEYCTKLLLKQD